ncbi:MAG: M24 family metallopeptidase, partial [Pseudomonadota bacterium]
CDVWRVMTEVTGRQGARFGHGLGLHLTEGLSFLESDETVLQEGMVLTLEPYISTREGRTMVHEEVIALTGQGAQPLTRFAGPDLPVI